MLKQPGMPSVPSNPTAPMPTHTPGRTASWSRLGEPSVTSCSTSSGRRTASTRPSVPPRLWPTRTAWRPVRSTTLSKRASSRSTSGSMQAVFSTIPLRYVRKPPERNHAAIRESVPSLARKPGINRTGRPSPAGGSGQRAGSAVESHSAAIRVLPPRRRGSPPVGAAGDSLTARTLSGRAARRGGQHEADRLTVHVLWLTTSRTRAGGEAP